MYYLTDPVTENRTQNSKHSLPQPLAFGAVFIKEKLVPNRVEWIGKHTPEGTVYWTCFIT